MLSTSETRMGRAHLGKQSMVNPGRQKAKKPGAKRRTLLPLLRRTINRRGPYQAESMGRERCEGEFAKPVQHMSAGEGQAGSGRGEKAEPIKFNI